MENMKNDEGNGVYEVKLEYRVNTTPNILFQRLFTPYGLSEWFADDVNLLGNTYTFIWNGSTRKAELVEKKENKYIKFRWIEAEGNSKTNYHFTFICSPRMVRNRAVIPSTSATYPNTSPD